MFEMGIPNSPIFSQGNSQLAYILTGEFPSRLYSHRGIPKSPIFSQGNSQVTYILEMGIPNSPIFLRWEFPTHLYSCSQRGIPSSHIFLRWGFPSHLYSHRGIPKSPIFSQ